jgi:hypothetical protein
VKDPGAIVRDGNWIEQLKTDARAEGWTFKHRFVDNDPEQDLLGVRLTNANLLFDRSMSVQIFDRQTVTLSFGFSNDEHLSLTGDDGREFLLWLQQWKPKLMKELWNAIPEIRPEASTGPVALSLQTGKPALVNYLVASYPEIFGRFGEIANGDDFYDAVLRVIRNPERDDRSKAMLIHSLEELAHVAYADANSLLRSADLVIGQDNVQNVYREAHAQVTMAQRLRAHAGAIRSLMLKPPTPSPFSDEILAVQDFPPPRELTTNVDEIKPGNVVVVSDEKHALSRQIGEVVDANKEGARVRFQHTAQPIQIPFTQLRKLQ